MTGRRTWGSAAVVVFATMAPAESWKERIERFPKSIQWESKWRRQPLMMPSTVELALSCDPNASKIRRSSTGRFSMAVFVVWNAWARSTTLITDGCDCRIHLHLKSPNRNRNKVQRGEIHAGPEEARRVHCHNSVYSLGDRLEEPRGALRMGLIGW